MVVAADVGRIGRHPGDVLRVVTGVAVASACGVAATADHVSVFEHDVFRLVNHLPSSLELPLITVMQAGALGAVPACAAAALVTRRFRLARDLTISGTVAWVLAKVLKEVVARGRPGVLLPDVILRHAHDIGLGYPSGHAAVAAALATAAGAYLPRRARHVTWLVVVLVATARVYVGAHLPADVVGGAALGWFVGATVHLVFGAPIRGITVAQVRGALEAAGLVPVDLAARGLDARGSAPFEAEVCGGRRLFVKAIGREHRNADLLFKLWRFVALRHVEDEAPFVTPKQQVEHEALLLLLAARAGVRVPAAIAAVQSGPRPALLVMERLNGRSLADLEPPTVTSELLCAIWEQVRLLRNARIAHRDLRPANILVGSNGEPYVVDFGFAELSASEHRLAQDVAQLLVSTALLVGSDRAVDAAVSVLGGGAVAAAIPLLQPPALAGSTRSALRHQRGVLVDLRSAASERTVSDDVELERLVRIRPATIAWLASALFAVHVLLPQVGEVHRTLGVIGHAQPSWLVAALALSAGTYVAAAVAQFGTVAPRLALGRTVAVQLAGSFANRLTPASLGGLGVSIRYLQRAGLERAEAVGASAANTLAGFVVHATMLFSVGVVVGRSGAVEAHLPARWLVLVAVVVAMVVAGLALVTSTGRRRVLAPAGRSVRELTTVVRNPRRAAELFGGSFAVTALYIGALFCSLHAFGGSLGWARVAVAYLGAAAVAAAAPTPGGLGAMEAALVAALTALGGATAPSVAGVLAFRLATFWLPIAPGWVSFHLLRRRAVI